LSIRQQKRLVGAAEIVLATHPQWGIEGVRFDIVLVDSAGVVRRISDAFRGDVLRDEIQPLGRWALSR
jgi:putative endonuclease